MDPQAAATVVIGQIGAPYGVKGWVHVRSFTAPQNNIEKFSPWRLSADNNQAAKVVELEQLKAHNKHFVAKLANIADRDAAAAFTNCCIIVDRTALPALAQDEYYLADLMGVTVYNTAGNHLGEVTDFLETGANGVVVVSGKKEHLIPYVLGEFILSVNLDKKEMQVEWDAEF